ncbi:MAG: HNH endonuclease [Kiritimatiellia bacterium]
MPNRPKRPCNHPGCRELVQPPERYCAGHQREAQQQRADTHRHYDATQRNQRARVFYNSPEWEAVRKAVLMRDHHLCQKCLRTGRITPADAVHHIEELLKAWHRRLDMSNLVSICESCHNAERRR